MLTVLVMRSQGITSRERAGFEKVSNGQGFEIREGSVSSRRSSKGWLAECHKAGPPQEVKVVTTPRDLFSRISDRAVSEGYEHSAPLPK